MKIHCLKHTGVGEALLGLGLSYGFTSDYDKWEDVPEGEQVRITIVAQRLADKGNGENKFLRMVQYWWSVTAPRYWWSEADTYKVATVAQSESTMHTIMHRELTQEDFERHISHPYLYHLNLLIKKYKETRDKELFLQLKNSLPEGFLQRRIWQLSLAQMLNIYKQRKNHRLPEWKCVCDAFVEKTPYLFRGMYNG